MDLTDRVDPELLASLRASSLEWFTWDDLPATRRLFTAMRATMVSSLPDSRQVIKEDRTIPGPESAPDVPVRVYRPAGHVGTLPGFLWIHGGGFVVGDIAMNDLSVQGMVEEINCIAVSVEYRLAPEHPFPAPLEDCYAALKWLYGQAASLGVDPLRIAVCGSSVGGGLAAAVSLLARDRGEVPIAFQLLSAAALDDRSESPSLYANADPRVWVPEFNVNQWRAYLGGDPDGAVGSPYAAVARAENLSGLPPAYIAVGALDVLLDEDMEYARRLLQVGVPVELHTYPGFFHGAEGFAASAAISRRFIAERNQALKRALHATEVLAR